MKIIYMPSGHSVLVDDADYDVLSKYAWHFLRSRKLTYAQYTKYGNGKKVSILMHRMILGVEKGTFIDHIDGNGLNNQRKNLRIATPSENLANRKKISGKYTSGYKGVRLYKKNNTWVAQIRKNRITYHLGYYKTEMLAAKAYDKKAVELYGEFALLNFPNNN